MAEEFVLPELTPTPSGWGPTSVPSGFANIPFAPFRKNDRLGKAADFSSFRGQQSRRAADEEERFEVVDTTKVKRVDIRKYYRRQGYQNNHHAQRAAAQQQVVKTGRGTKQRQSRRRKNYSRRYYRRPQNNVVREPSLRIRSTWEMVDQFDLPALSKLSTTVPSAEDLRWCGSLKRFDPKFDRLSSRATRDLRSFTDRMFFSETAQEDPIIDEIASDSSMGCNVFTTDAVLAHLMTAQRTVYPWDIVITVYPGGVVSLDGRDHQQFERPTVYETANVPPTEENDDDINSRASLTAEATLINYNFSQQVLAAASVTDVPDASANPFWSPEAGNGAPAADVMYRYRKWQVTPDICLAARTTIHAAQPKKDGTLQYVTLHALNEWDPKASNARPWRQQIDTQRGGVVATELKNNASKMAKWVASTILSGADQMKVGFVSRMTPKSRDRHVILGVQNYDPENFAHQASLTQTNMWGVLRWLIELVRAKADQYRTDDEEVMKFALMRDPNKPLIMLYRVPVDAFDTDQEGEDDEDEDEDEDDIDDSDIDVGAGGGRLV